MANKSAPTSKRRRRWPYIAAASSLLVIFIILLIPTIASFGPARSYVLSKINAKLQGKLQIKSWSLGWGSGFGARGVTLADKKGEILSIQSLSTGLTLRQIIRGDYALGNVVLDGLHFDIRVDEDGKTNLQRAIESATHAQPAEGNAQPAQSSAQPPDNSALPNVSANITLTNIAGTITRPGSPPVAITVQGSLKIPNINQPIDNDLSATLQSGSAGAGSITCKGQVSVIENNHIVDASKMDIRENVSLKNIELSVLSPFLPMETIDTVNGLASGDLDVKKYPDRGLVADGELRAEHVMVSGPALRGDIYSTNSVELKIPNVAITPDQMIGMSEPIQILFDQGSFSITAQGPVSALQNICRNQAPASNGLISAEFHADCAALSRQLPHTLDLRSGLTLNSAQLALSAKIILTPDHASVVQHLELSHISGTDDNQPITFSPITLDSSAAVLPSHRPLPIIRNVTVKLASDFTSADFHGDSLADFGGSAQADLALAQRQLAQIFAFHNWQLQGLLHATLACHGDLADQSAPIQIDSRVQADNLNVTGGAQSIHEQSAVVILGGKILRDGSDALTGIDNLKITLQTNDNGQSITACTAAGSLRLHRDQSSWRMLQELHLHLDLPDLPRTAALVQAMQLQGVHWTSGHVTAEINLAESNGILSGDSNLSATDLAFTHGSRDYHFEPIQFVAAGKMADNEIDIRKFDGSLGSMAVVQLIQPVVLKNSTTPTAQGEIRLNADLAKANALADAWNDVPSPQKLSGQLAMDQTFSTNGSNISANGNGTISDLKVETEGQTQFQEKSLKITNDLSFDSSAQSVTFNSCSIAMPSSHALDATLTGAIRHLSTTRDFDNVRVELAYDLKALLAIITPMLPPADQQQLSQYAITGAQKHQIAITGSFPVGQKLETSIRQVRVNGSIGLDKLEGNGVTITNLSPDFTLKDGVVTIVGNGKMPAQLNGGALNLVGASYNLGDPAQRISMPANMQLVQGTQLNAPMMGKFGSNLNPVLSNPTQAAGVLNVSIDQCSNFSIAQFSNPLATGTSPGTLKVTFSVGNVQIANNMAVVIGAFSPQSVLNHQLIGNIDNAQLSINNGMIWSNLKLRIGKNLMLGFHGYINLQTQELQQFILDFPPPLFGDFASLVHLKNLPTDIPIPITGTTSHYTLDLTGLNQLADAAKNDIEKGANKVGKAVGNGVNHASKFFNGLFHHDDNSQQ